MVLEYFTWARAKKNKEELEKTNPKNPVLKEDDEEFLHRITSQDAPPAPLPPSVISDDGRETELQSEESKQAAEAAGTTALPSSPSKESPSALDELPSQEQPSQGVKDDITRTEETDTTLDTKPNATEEVPTTETTKDPSKEDVDPPKQSEMEEPSLDNAEAEKADLADQTDGTKATPTKRTWGSYVPSLPSVNWKAASKDVKKSETDQSASATTDSDNETTEKVDEKLSTAYPEGVKVTEDIKLDQDDGQTQDEKEVSVLLDRLNLSSINNRVFSFSKKSQQIYEDFTIVLKDMINGVPTAYEDMEKLLKENEGHLNETFNNMPPFVQTLVKSLPAKLGSTLGPEVFAAASDKPGADLKSKLAAASKDSSSSPPLATAQKKKRSVPTTKALANEKGAVASMLSNIVNFLKIRFPILLSTTNVVMSIAVFILLLVFWYCHKRGKETRLLKAAEGEQAVSSDNSDLEDSEFLEKMQEVREEKPEDGAAENDDNLTAKTETVSTEGDDNTEHK